MFELIEKLRAKPDRTKKQIAFCISLLLAGIIFVIWLTIIYPDFRGKQTKEKTVSSSEPSPFSNFADTFSSGISAIGEQFNKIKESISSFSTTTSTTTVQ